MQKGFTLLEVIIAIFIVITALVGSLTIVNLAISAMTVSGDRLTAANLAQEGVELTRHIRDLSGEDWGVWHNGIASGDYTVQYNDIVLRPFSSAPLKFDSPTGLYNYDAGDNTFFIRKVSLTKLSDNNVRVISEIAWRERGRDHRIAVEDNLWNWK